MSALQEYWDVAPELAARMARAEDAAKAKLATLRQDAERYRWLAARMLAADFDYGGDGTQALVFEMPDGFRASADCGATIDAAMAMSDANSCLPNVF